MTIRLGYMAFDYFARRHLCSMHSERVEFAKAALTGLISKHGGTTGYAPDIADDCFDVADAMIERLYK